jgi:predicted enzyme related to lactoylglutathione lyase
MKQQFLMLMVLVVMVSGAYGQAAQDSGLGDTPSGIWAVKLNVVDLNRAVEFYTRVLELEISAQSKHTELVALKSDDVHILLRPVDSLTKWDYDKSCRVNLNFYVEDLTAYIKKFKSENVNILDDTVRTAGVGKFLRIADPSGNSINIMQLGYEHEPVTRPTLYNTSAIVTDMKVAREFYEGMLGFEVLTENYYPPAIPYRVRNVQLVLHEGGKVVSTASYTSGSQTNLVLIVEDLKESLDKLNEAGFAALLRENVKDVAGLQNAVRDPDGNVIELLEWKDNLFDQSRR